MSKESRELDRIKAVVEASLVKWKPIMGLGHWSIASYYHRADASLPKKYRRQAKTGWGALMWVGIHWEYLDATVNVALHRIVEQTDDEIDVLVRHELAHVVVNEMREMVGIKDFARAVKHEERTVTMLAYAFQQAYVAGWNEGREALRKEIPAWTDSPKDG